MVTVARRSGRGRTDLVVVPLPRDGGGAFAGFYNTELAGQVRRAALLIGDRDDARDLVHDAFIEVYRRWDELDEPGPYLNRVVLNRCRDRARHAARQRRARVVGPVAGPDGSMTASMTRVCGPRCSGSRSTIERCWCSASTISSRRTRSPELSGVVPVRSGPWIDRGLRQLRKDLQ